MPYALDDLVQTPKGKGRVSYVEDGYLEVTVNGVEMSFEAPFAGITPWVEPAPVRPNNDDISKAQAILDRLPVAIMEAVQIKHTMVADVVVQLGGEAAAWEALTATQKLNLVSVSTGISIAALQRNFSG